MLHNLLPDRTSISVREFQKAYENQLEIEYQNNDILALTYWIALRRISRLETIDQIFEHAIANPNGRTFQVLNNWSSTQGHYHPKKDNLTIERNNPVTISPLLNHTSPPYITNRSNRITPDKQQTILIKHLSCNCDELNCLQSGTGTGSVWQYKNTVYKIFTSGSHGRSAHDQAEFEKTCWNRFYRSIDMNRYAIAKHITLDNNMDVMITPHIEGIKPSLKQLNQLELSVIQMMSATVSDLYENNNCLLLPNSVVTIIDFGEWRPLSGNEKQVRLEKLEYKLGLKRSFSSEDHDNPTSASDFGRYNNRFGTYY